MVIDFSQLNLRERPILILKNTSGDPIGLLGYARNVTLDIKYNETSVIEFEIPAVVDGVNTPFYDAVGGLRTLEIAGIGQFILVNPQEIGDGVKRYKSCKGYSLEYEFAFKKITLENSTYNFWNPVTPESTLLGIILEEMPAWSVGSVDKVLVGRYRTFEVSDENIYNFIKGTVQNSYNCIFDFDTNTRKINVREASSAVPVNPVFISGQNLAKEISVEEDTENIVTRLDVNGADGVTIRDVNPSGTNKIIDLNYFMTTENFDQSIIDKYRTWEAEYKNYQLPYYNLSVEYALQVMRATTEKAAQTELESDLTVLENEQAVIIQGIAQDLKEQSDLDEVNKKISDKQDEINAKKKDIAAIEKQMSDIHDKLADINKAVSFKSIFTEQEYLLLDRYIKDDSVSESSFVANTTRSYENASSGSAIKSKTFSVTNSAITYVAHTEDKAIYDMVGGSIAAKDVVKAEIIRAAIETAPNGSFIMTAYLGNGTSGDKEFPKGCISLTGTVSKVVCNMKPDEDGVQTAATLSFTISSGYLYFTMDTSEYEKRAVAWDLFEYGKEILSKISQPSYKFNVTSANFLCLDDFISFKNCLRHGEKIYVAIDDSHTLSPILIGAKFSFDDMTALELEFGDTYTSGDNSFLLADLLEQSVSMGKSVDLNKFSYSAFMASGASTKVKEFIDSALDVSKNAIMSSKNQAISWGDSGIRLRKWADETHTTYDPEQVWMNNNSILMTSNNWATAEIAIGSFKDKNTGDCWGIVAPNIVGTLLAGSNLVIESEKADGGVAVFKVDGDGCFLHNSSMSITGDKLKSQILLDPSNGLLIGKYPLLSSSGAIDDENRLFYADIDGNLILKGTIYASAGEFTGKVTATSGYIGNSGQGWTIIDNAIYNGKGSFSDNTEGIYIGVDGISLGTGEKYIRANKSGYLSANNINVSGTVTALKGYIGNGNKGWSIGDTAIYNGKAALNDDSNGIYIGVDGISIRQGNTYIRLNADGSLEANSATITGNITATAIDLSNADISGTLSANYINGGTIDADNINVENLNAANLNKGLINAARLSDANNRLSSLYVDSGYFNTIQMYRGTISFTYAASSSAEGSVSISGAGVGYDGSVHSWADIIAGTNPKAAVFG